MPNRILLKYVIYGLVDPRSMLVRYIGRSSNGVDRPRTHRYKRALDANTRCATWVKALLNLGLAYNIVILETMATAKKLNEAERWWIAYGLLSEWPLTNHTLGGEGQLGISPTPESRASRSAKLKGRIFSDEHRIKISKAKKGVPKSEEHRLKLSAAVVLIWQDEDLRRRQREARLGKLHTPEHKAKISAALSGRKPSAEAVVNRTAGRRRYFQRLRDSGIKNPLAGRARSPETRAKISATRQKRKRL